MLVLVSCIKRTVKEPREGEWKEERIAGSPAAASAAVALAEAQPLPGSGAH